MEDIKDSSLCNISCFGSIIKRPYERKFLRIRDKKLITLYCISSFPQDFDELVMEKEEVEESSPRGVLDNSIGSIESETSSSKNSSLDFETQLNPRSGSQWRAFFNSVKTKSIRRLTSFPPASSTTQRLTKKHGRSMREKSSPLLIAPEETNMYNFKSSWKNFSLAQLQAATKNFCSANMIGKGGYAEVYKGCLQGGQLVAVKRLTRGSSDERIRDFLSELGIIVHVDHPNTAKLIGYGIEGGMHLVLELSPHECLASLLHGSKTKLGWGIRYNIALGTARGLLYLHEGCPRRIIHRDIKASNILLTQGFEPQICDFGLAKWLPEQWTHHTVSGVEGTFGYLAPEYLMHGIVDEKTDVFAFGVLLLELITGRQALDGEANSLVLWAKPFLVTKNIRALMDPSIDDSYDLQQINRVALTASLCLQQSAILRPRMRQVVKLLRGDETNMEWAKESQSSFQPKIVNLEELFESENNNPTRYQHDLNGCKKIALGF